MTARKKLEDIERSHIMFSLANLDKQAAAIIKKARVNVKDEIEEYALDNAR